MLAIGALLFAAGADRATAAGQLGDSAFYERRIRPIFVKHCYECHSEAANEQQGGLLLDRQSGWLKGGDTEKAVVPGEPEASLLVKAIRYADEALQMPPETQLNPDQIRLLEQWVAMGAPGAKDDLGDTEFSRLGDQEYLFARAEHHWAFQPVTLTEPPEVADPAWNQDDIDRFVYDRLQRVEMKPSPMADDRTLLRRLNFDLTGLPPTFEETKRFVAEAAVDRTAAVSGTVDRLLNSPAFGEHFGRLWLDVARYADTDSFYRPDTRTPHYFPFAFTYRDYVVAAFNADKPFDQFIREQFAADLLGLDSDAPELAALGFLTVGPHANRNPTEAVDDWIDVTTRGLMGITVACARCHDHKYEPVPTADYYALHGVFASLVRVNPLDEGKLPTLSGYKADPDKAADYAKKREAIDKKIKAAGGSKAKNNNRSVAQKIRETELAQLLLFHPGAPVHTMVVTERPKAIEPYIFMRGDPTSRGPSVPRRFLKVLDSQQEPFHKGNSGRLQLAEKIIDPSNPLTSRVFVNRVWGHLMGSHLVATPSDFGLQGAAPTHPELLDSLVYRFVSQGWSLKHLVRSIVLSRTYQQSSLHREDAAALDPQNKMLWRANRKHLSIEAIRDSVLAVSAQLDRTPRGRPAELWDENYTRRRAIYGFVNRFNLDPTLRAFDFPTPMQTQPARGESIVAPQALFTMNAPFMIDQSIALTTSERFIASETDAERAAALFAAVFQRQAAAPEVTRIVRFVELQERFFTEPKKNARIKSPWPLVAQSLLMSNEFQYVD
jgi:mono/diheme cytochrome c family protein